MENQPSVLGDGNRYPNGFLETCTVIAPQLVDLNGLALSRIGCALDLFWMQFGPLREVTDHKGRPKTVGELALHINVPWRFSDETSIVIGNRDLYFYSDGEHYDFNRGGESRFHIYASTFNEHLSSSQIVVESAETDHAGGLRLRLSKGYTFEAFPNVAHTSPGFEFWRLLAPALDGPHLVRDTGSVG